MESFIYPIRDSDFNGRIDYLKDGQVIPTQFYKTKKSA